MSPTLITAQRDQEWKEWFLYRLGEPGSVDAIRVLLTAGADPNKFDDGEITPLGVALTLNPSSTHTLYPGCAEMVEALLDAGADPNRPCGRGHSPLSLAACLPEADLLTVLLDRGARLPGAGVDPVHMAVKFNRMDSLDRLIKAGAPLDQADQEGELPLTRALEKGMWFSAWAMLAAGAPTHPSGPLHRSPLLVACQNPSSSVDLPRIIRRLVEEGSDINAPDTLGRTPLVYLVAQINADTPATLALLKIMLRAGADPRIPDNHGRTVLSSPGIPPLTAAVLQEKVVELDAAQLQQETASSLPARPGPRL